MTNDKANKQNEEYDCNKFDVQQTFVKSHYVNGD